MDPQRLVYDWNRAAGEGRPRHIPVGLVDETLRDGLQSPSAVTPPLDEKFELLVLMERLGIDTAIIGIPAAGDSSREDVEWLVRRMTEEGLSLMPGCAARTLAPDIEPIIGISQRVGRALEMTTFIGSPPVRPRAQDVGVLPLVKLTPRAR